jgi:hypothetical protein
VQVKLGKNSKAKSGAGALNKPSKDQKGTFVYICFPSCLSQILPVIQLHCELHPGNEPRCPSAKLCPDMNPGDDGLILDFDDSFRKGP